MLVVFLARLMLRRAWKPTGRIAVTGTFHNPGWYFSHITPLAESGIDEVILVVDEPTPPIDGVRCVCPPRWLARMVSRAGAKFIWMVVTGLRFKPDLYMGYHIVPGACSALVVGKLFGRPTCYQMTGGPIEVLGGGKYNESWLSSSLARPSALLERLAMAVIRQFDLVIVRGRRAQAFLSHHGIKQNVRIVTGSVMPPGANGNSFRSRPVDFVFVGRLAEIKQPKQFLEVVAAVHRVIPGVRAAVIGEGPLLPELQQRSRVLGLTDSVEFLGKQKAVGHILAQSKVFVLTSRSEGLSIALAEAMASGTVPLVADVGELRDLVESSTNGYLIQPDRIDQYAEKAVMLLQDEGAWSRLSRAAATSAQERCGLAVVRERWNAYLRHQIISAAGARTN